MIFAKVDEQGYILTVYRTNDASVMDSDCIELVGYTEWELTNNNLFQWDFENKVWIIGAMPVELPPVDPNQQRHDQLAAAGFTEEEIRKIIAIN